MVVALQGLQRGSAVFAQQCVGGFGPFQVQPEIVQTLQLAHRGRGEALLREQLHDGRLAFGRGDGAGIILLLQQVVRLVHEGMQGFALKDGLGGGGLGGVHGIDSKQAKLEKPCRPTDLRAATPRC